MILEMLQKNNFPYTTNFTDITLIKCGVKSVILIKLRVNFMHCYHGIHTEIHSEF